VLAALEFFFDGTPLEPADVSSASVDGEVSVRVTFSDLAVRDRDVLGAYASGGAMTLTRRWSGGQSKLTGKGRRFPGFAPIRSAGGAGDIRSAYSRFRQEAPGFELPAVRSAADAEAALSRWEHEHDGQCIDEDVEATHLFGATGEAKLASRIRFVRAPAVKEAASEAQEGRNTILGRLLALIAEQRMQADQALQEIQTDVQQRYERAIEQTHDAPLQELASRMEHRLNEYLSSGRIELGITHGVLRLPQPVISLRAGELGELTDIGRQGHGFQRAFLIAMLQMLAEQESLGDETFAIVLAIEEPELYQHPTRVRRLARALDRLSQRDDSRFQVCYTTHSPYLVDQRHYERIRLFRRGSADESLRTCASATQADVARMLEGLVRPEEIERRLGRTLDVSFNECFFSNAVILTEGDSDVGAIQGAAERLGVDLDELGISVTGAEGKSALPVRYAVLAALRIPVFVVFDADAGCKEGDRAGHEAQNTRILRTLGLEGDFGAFPGDVMHQRFVCFANTIEDYLRGQLRDFDQRLALASGGDWRKKPAQSYRELVAGAEEIPPLLAHTVIRTSELVAVR
jgi:putative ATP-dependent endonuclease of the OLD family